MKKSILCGYCNRPVNTLDKAGVIQALDIYGFELNEWTHKRCIELSLDIRPSPQDEGPEIPKETK